MKTLLVAAGMAGVIGIAGTAHAATVEVNVPFPFKVEGKTMPAGSYRIQTDGAVAELENETQHVTMFVLTRNADRLVATKAPALAFTREKDGYTLADIRVSPSEQFELPR